MLLVVIRQLQIIGIISMNKHKIDAVCIIWGNYCCAKNKFSIIKSIIYSWYNVDPSSETEGGHTKKKSGGELCCFDSSLWGKENIRQEVHSRANYPLNLVILTISTL